MRKAGFLAIFILTQPCAGQLAVEHYGALPTFQNMAVSPDGERVAFRLVRGDRDVVRVVSLRDKQVVAAVDVSDVKPRDVFFANDSTVLLQVAENRRVRGFRGRFDVSTMFSLDVDSSEVKQLLVPGDGTVYPGQQGIGRVVGVSADREDVLMPAFYGNPTRVMGELADPLYSLLRVSVDGSRRPKVAHRGSPEAIDFFIGADGQVLAMEEFHESDNLHRVLSNVNGSWKTVFAQETSVKNLGFVGLTPDRERLVYVRTDAATGRRAYFSLSLETGESEGPLHVRDDADIEGVIVGLDRIVRGLRYSGMTPSYLLFDDQLDARVRKLQDQFPGHTVALVDNSPDWTHIVVLVEGSQSSGQYYLSSAGEEPRFLADRRPAIPHDQVNPIGTVTYAARDGMHIPTVITIPADKVGELQNLPAVVMPHGGPASHDAVGFNYRAQALAARGYLVIMPQFRGSSGFGRDHQIAGYGEWGRKMQDDISDAVAFFSDRGMIDPERVCIVGGSYGGYAALAGGAFTPDLYQCVVSINGIGNLVRFRNWIRREVGRYSESLAWWEIQIGGDAYTADEAKLRSPELSAGSFSAPVLLIHSEADEIVPFSQSKRMFRALRRADKSVELLELDGDDHYLSFGETRIRALEATVAFVMEHI